MGVFQKFTFLLFSSLLLFACKETEVIPESNFYLLSSDKTQVDFSNDLAFDKEFNIYTYRNFYNGGGVGIADVNNDGFVDLYFTANMKENKLYLNNGDLSFTDATVKAGVGGTKKWSTGVSMSDVNSDGLIDIYVCNSGDVKGDNKQNELFINQGDGTFVEEAEKFGLADQGYSTHAVFFDYDKDGDLDMYLLNNSFQAIGSFNLTVNQRPIRDAEGGDKLFRNEGGTFIDVSEEAGIYGSVIGFGLGVTVGDIDQDGWLDLYISNDFFERDYIYMNNGDGTFRENLTEQMRSISGASMGADMADINNDGYPDIFVTEMLPEPNDRLKTKTTFEDWNKYQYNVENGYYHQFTRNMLHLNNGNNNFSEIGRLAGVEATDWSWGALISDFDNDGYKDLFIANGIYKDLTDQDYIKYISTREMAKSVISADGVDFQKLTEVIPSNKVPNYMYKNNGKLQFENVTAEWGMDTPSHSNGSAYGDLDNDGDLDIVINNSNAEASIYLNQSKDSGNYIKLNLKGRDKNIHAIGTRITAYAGDDMYYHEQVPVRGFQSSMDPRPNIGLGIHERVDSLKILWYDNSVTTIKDVESNQTLSIDIEDEGDNEATSTGRLKSRIFESVDANLNIDYTHVENEFIDFDRDRLLYHMLSAEGPAICKGDFNGDGRADIFLGGAKDESAKMYLQTKTGSFRKANHSVFEKDLASEDVDCACFDADNDGDIDLYVASGGNEYPNSSSALIDRLYLNNGKGEFKKSSQILPSFKFENSSSVKPFDFDEDGDIDLFVGVRAKPFLIGVPASAYLLVNDGKGNFENATKTIAPELQDLGMITDGAWADIDADGDADLVIVGEWMGITIFKNENGKFKNSSDEYGLTKTSGWWNKIIAEDIDGDDDIDFVIANHGLNSRFSASEEKPVTMYVNDFDQNGSAEPIVCVYLEDKSYPLALKHDLIRQLPSLQKKYVQYEAYKDETIEDIFTPEQLQNALKAEVQILESVVLINENNSSFELRKLPIEAQLAPTYDIEVADFDRDGNLDLLLGGNFYYAKPEVGIYDASIGCLLKGDGKTNFEYVPNRVSGLKIEGQVREIENFAISNRNYLLIARNDDALKVIQY